jgi:hypothetical protein
MGTEPRLNDAVSQGMGEDLQVEEERLMERFETKSLALMPGQLVQAKVLSHHPWGVLVEILGYEARACQPQST